MKVHVNGTTHEFEKGTTIRQMLTQLGWESLLVAVEQNRVVIPRGKHGETQLAEGDDLEVVEFVGGG